MSSPMIAIDWRVARNNLYATLEKNPELNIDFAFKIVQFIAAEWLKATGVMFLALPDAKRTAIMEWLQALEEPTSC